MRTVILFPVNATLLAKDLDDRVTRVDALLRYIVFSVLSETGAQSPYRGWHRCSSHGLVTMQRFTFAL